MTENNSSNTFFIVLLFIAFFIVLYLFGYLKELDPTNFQNYLNDTKVELFGRILDIFIFGIIFYSLHLIFQKQETINRLTEELDDFRDWDEKIAGYRVIGILKRLHKLGVENVNLSRCHFNEINIISDDGRIFGFDFKASNLTDVTFTGIKLTYPKFDRVCGNSVADYADYFNDPRTIFTNCDLRSPSFSNNKFHSFNFVESKLQQSKFADTQFYFAQFRNCIFEKGEFKNVTFTSSSFHNTDITNVSFENVKFEKCTFINCIYPIANETIIFEQCRYEDD